MINVYLKYILQFAFYLFLQVLVLNNISIFGIAAPLLYIYPLLGLPTSVSRNWVITIGFAQGLVMDLFCNTYGMHALTSVTTAYLLKPIVSLFYKRDSQVEEHSIRTMGTLTYMSLSLTLISVHHFILYTIEYFSFYNLYTLFFKFIASVLLTMTLIFLIENIKKSLRD